MTPLTRSLRNGAVTATAAAALLALTSTAALANGAAPAEVDVTHHCTSIDVSSSQSISNVVLTFADGDTQRFEGLPESLTGTFAGTGDDIGEVITTAWIKSGNNKSGDGPGYGERFDFDTADCDDSSSGGDVQAGSAGNSITTNDDTAAAASTNHDGGDDDANGSDEQSDVADDDAATTEQVAASTGTETPATSVLGAVEQREAGTGLRSADASVRGAETLPNAGGDSALFLAMALAALALGGGLLRRTSRSSA